MIYVRSKVASSVTRFRKGAATAGLAEVGAAAAVGGRAVARESPLDTKPWHSCESSKYFRMTMQVRECRIPSACPTVNNPEHVLDARAIVRAGTYMNTHVVAVPYHAQMHQDGRQVGAHAELGTRSELEVVQ